MFLYGSVFELLICKLRNGVFNLLLGELHPRENEVIPAASQLVTRSTRHSPKSYDELTGG